MKKIIKDVHIPKLNLKLMKKYGYPVSRHKSFGKAISDKIKDLIKKGKLKSFGEIWSKICSREQDKDKFVWHEPREIITIPPDRAVVGDILDCPELRRKFFCQDDHWLVSPYLYMGDNLIKISREMGDKLLKNKHYFIVHTIIDNVSNPIK